MTVAELLEALDQATDRGLLRDQTKVYLQLPASTTGCLLQGVSVLRLPDDQFILLLESTPKGQGGIRQ